MNALGIELGSTRIKAVLIDEARNVIARGVYNWENKFENGFWTYDLRDAWKGVREAVSQITAQRPTSNVNFAGVSAMMHGYLAFDKNGELLTPFRTWRNTNAKRAAEKLTELFNFNIPLRWSAAHLYQAILDGERHVKDIAYITTLSGYVHWKLTGEFVLGVGDASGMFPIENGDYNPRMVEQFKELTGIDWNAIAPKVLLAGQNAGSYENIPMCPPEGDAGTGMVATNAVEPRTGNVSAGTSVFAMVVLEKALSKAYPEIDIVTTPWGKDAAMVHCNECAVRIDPWVKLFGEAIELFGFKVESDELFSKLYETALGEGALSNFMREKLAYAVSELSEGIALLAEKEDVKIDVLTGHGGYFKSGEAGRRIMSETLGIPMKLVENSSEGGAFGMAVLAALIERGAL